MMLRIAVSDTGIGIPADKLDTIFDSFSQADGSTTRRYGGTGLGLTICSQLVRMMQGRIWVESEYTKGSTFFFTIRLGVLDGAGRLAAPQARDLQGLRVLVVDDDEAERRALEEQLTGWGMRPTSVTSGSEAVVALRTASAVGRPFALCILDVAMPEVDGIAVVRQVEADPKLAAVAKVFSAG